jgi:hypothetical protein
MPAQIQPPQSVSSSVNHEQPAQTAQVAQAAQPAQATQAAQQAQTAQQAQQAQQTQATQPVQSLQTDQPTQAAQTAQPAQTEYRFRTRTSTVDRITSDSPYMSGWNLVGSESAGGTLGPWSGWQDAPRAANENLEVETRSVDIGTRTEIFLGRFYSSRVNKYSPGRLDSSYAFEGGWIDESHVRFIGQAFAGGRTDCYQYIAAEIPWYRNYFFFPIGEFGGQRRTVSLGTKTQYRYRELIPEGNTIYHFERVVYGPWSEFSQWQSAPVQGDDLTDVETRVS